MTAIAAPPLTAEPLWEGARFMFARMRRAVGEAAKLAERAWLSKQECAAIRSWLAPLIAMVRKIVLVEAIALVRAKDFGVQKRQSRKACQQHFSPPPCGAGPGVGVTTAHAQKKQRCALRLWPAPRWGGPRIRQLGPPLLVRDIWRENKRAAAADLLKRVRFMRPPPGVQLARRIEALARILERPLNAARRLARKLRTAPNLALTIATPALPRTERYHDDAYFETFRRVNRDAYGWRYPDTS